MRCPSCDLSDTPRNAVTPQRSGRSRQSGATGCWRLDGGYRHRSSCTCWPSGMLVLRVALWTRRQFKQFKVCWMPKQFMSTLLALQLGAVRAAQAQACGKAGARRQLRMPRACAAPVHEAPMPGERAASGARREAHCAAESKAQAARMLVIRPQVVRRVGAGQTPLAAQTVLRSA